MVSASLAPPMSPDPNTGVWNGMKAFALSTMGRSSLGEDLCPGRRHLLGFFLRRRRAGRGGETGAVERDQFFCCPPQPMSCSAPGNGARVRLGLLSGRAVAGRWAFSLSTTGLLLATPTAPISTKHSCSPSSPIRHHERGRLRCRAKIPTTGRQANGRHRSTS